MGYRVSHRFAPIPDGRPGTAFVRISRDTFIEIAPAAADAKPSITHIGVGADNIKATGKSERRESPPAAARAPTAGQFWRISPIPPGSEPN